VVTFTNDVLSTFHNFSALEGYTMMTVSRYTGGDNERIFGSMDRNWLFGYHGNGVNEWHAEGWIYNGTVTDTDWHLHAGTITNDADPRASLWDNGVNIVTDGTGSHATNYRMDRLALGGWRDNGETSNSQIAEVLIFEGVLTEEEINGIGIYLDQKYGLDTEYRGEIAALSLPDRNYTVEADSTLNALTDFTATLGALTLQEGVATVTGAPGGVSFSSTTLPETAGTAGITAQTAVAGGPLTINAGVLRTRGSVSFDATTIPGTATAVGFDVDADVDLGVISGAGAGHQVAVSKVGSGMLSLTETNIGLEDATWVAGGGTLKMATPGSWGGSKKATLAGGTLVVSDVIGAPGTGTNPDNPLAYWSFDNVVGATVVNDGTAGAVGDGTLSGDAAIVSGLIGNAGSFDGTDDFVDVAQIATGVESASYAVWVKMGKFPPDNMDSVWHNDSWGGGDVHFLIRNSGTPGMSVNGAGPNDADGIAVLTDVGEWHHLAVVYDGVEKTRTYYFDGQQSVVRTHTNDRTLNIGPAQIAAWNSNREFEGLYDEFLIYDEALSVADVVQMFAERTAPDVSDVDVTVDANSALESQSLSGLGFKSLTINNGILTTTGLNGISFTSTTIDPNATRVGFNTTTATSLGPLDGGNTAATIAKTGSGDLILSDPGSNLGNAT
ncbi:MAG: LamG domain-containing protein, partial [Candidatus Nealsonbacteria bacterium]|nr:LamG domain-containing protein [Candidatus Nealsonbacteria bacterium]